MWVWLASPVRYSEGLILGRVIEIQGNGAFITVLRFTVTV